MKKTFFILSLLFIVTSCVSSELGVSLFANIKEPKIANSVKNKDNKVGVACSSKTLYLFVFGDSSIDSAKRDGNVEVVSSVDSSLYNFLGGLYAKRCTIVRGN